MRFPDGPIRAELEAFEYEYTRTGVRYSAPHGMHDDCVMALALAVQHHRGEGSRAPFVLTYLPPAEKARLIAEEMAWRAQVLREHGIDAGFGRGEPLETVLARIQGF